MGGDQREGKETRGEVRADGTRYPTKGLGEGKWMEFTSHIIS